ncbi:SGNH/GDSL hydrolase family protein [Microbacterium sp.]|uniref:SGNH/GDSL hydrolase family protein n=1 Tax=Microbacterium sp. TaxID=51671 RepID=UPI003F6E919A
MHAHGRPRARRSWLALAGVAAAVAIVCAFGLIRPSTASAPPAVAAADAAPPATAPLALPEHPTVLVFGDSWVYGSAANVPTLGFAYVAAEKLGWNAVVDGVRGSGYLKPGLDGPAYGERIAALDPALDPDLVIIEGSINDRRLYPDGYEAAVTTAWDALAAIYPDAQIVVLGPAPQVLPIEKATSQIDDELSALAADRGWLYISPIDQGWITDANYAAVIDTSELGNNHPSTEGHAYLAVRLDEALAALSGASAIVADAPVDGGGVR